MPRPARLGQAETRRSGAGGCRRIIMKTTQSVTNARNGKVREAQPPTGHLLAGDRRCSSAPRTDRSRIQWPTSLQMQGVSKQLERISREGRRSELAGDYFKSGDLAFQVQEIIRTTGELLKKSQRVKS